MFLFKDFKSFWDITSANIYDALSDYDKDDTNNEFYRFIYNTPTKIKRASLLSIKKK